MHIKPKEFRALLDLYMVSDPWPLSDLHQDQIRTMLNRLADEAKPGQSWIEAFHYYHPDTFGRIWWLGQAALCTECGQPLNDDANCDHRRINVTTEHARDLI